MPSPLNNNNPVHARASSLQKEFYRNVDNEIGNRAGEASGADDESGNSGHAHKGKGAAGHKVHVHTSHKRVDASEVATTNSAGTHPQRSQGTANSAMTATGADLANKGLGANTKREVNAFVSEVASGSSSAQSQSNYSQAKTQLQNDLANPDVSQSTIDQDVADLKSASGAMGVPGQAQQDLSNMTGTDSSLSSQAESSLFLAAAKAGIDPSKSDDKNKVDRARLAGTQKQYRDNQAQQSHQATSNGSGASGGDSGTGGNSNSGGTSGGTKGATTSGADPTIATQNATAAEQGDGKKTYTAASMADLMKAFPQLASMQDAFEAAGKQYNVQPQLLVAVAIQESGGGTNPDAYSNGGGMMQFTDAGAWAQYGGGAQTSDNQASIMAAGHYISDLLAQNGGDIGAALRAYNGPISQGGNPSYQSDIQNHMMGN